MNATISFENGQEIVVEKNGDSYISASRPEFPVPLGRVNITSEEETKDIYPAQVVECASIDGRYWFSFYEESDYEKTIRELRDENEMLEDAIAELAEIIGG